MLIDRFGNDIDDIKVFEESESRSLKEIKKHNKDIGTNKNKVDMRLIQQTFRKSLIEQTDFNRLVYSKNKNDCKTDADKLTFSYIESLVSKLPKECFDKNETLDDTHYSSGLSIKNKLCKIANLNPSKYGIAFNQYTPGESISIDFVEYSTSNNIIPKYEISQYVYLHFSHNSDINSLNPTKGSSHLNATYAKRTVFMWALKDQNLKDVINRLVRTKKLNLGIYGLNAYQYIPKNTDVIYMDITDQAKLGTQKYLKHFGFVPVFIETDKSLPVINVTKDFKSYIVQPKNEEKNTTDKEDQHAMYTQQVNDFERNYDFVEKQVKLFTSDTGKILISHLNEYRESIKSNNTSPRFKQKFENAIKSTMNSYNSKITNYLNDCNITDKREVILLRRKYITKLKRLMNDFLSNNLNNNENVKRVILKYIKESFNIIDEDSNYFMEGETDMEFRGPDMLRTYYMEASEDNDAPTDKETPTEEKDTTKKEDNASTPEETTSDNVGDDDEIDLSNFGNNGGDDLPNNEYDTSEVETLNKLIASEASAISEYAEAAKTSHEDILQRLYSDISDEERFHLEQLMFAKAELTGEKYMPTDPAVKREYEELLELGMDEESAMATAVDKTGLRAQVTVDNGEVPDAEQIENDVQALEYAIMNTELLLTILEQAEENRDQRILDQVCAFNEAFYQETVSNAQTYPREYYKPFNPFDALIKGFFGILNLLAKLIHNLKAHFRAGRFGLQQKLAWFRKHGIEGLLSQGISMYMWDDGRQQFDLQDVCHLANVLFQVTKDCGNAAKLDDSIMQPFNSIQKPFYTENPQYNRKLDLRESLNLISGIHMQPSKIVVQSDDAEAQLIETLFGYTDEMIPKFRPVESDPFVYRSKNIYNRIYYMMEAIEWYGEKTKSVLDQYKLLEGDQKSIYYNNHAAYKQNIENLKVMIKGYNKLVRALSHDVNVLASFDKYGTRNQTDEFDDNHNPNTQGRRATINVADDNKTNPPKVPNHTRTHL